MLKALGQGELEAVGAGATHILTGPPLSCPAGVVPEDQAPYVCKARNVFGEVQAEAQLVVTGHGSLVDLERGLWWGGRAPPGRPPATHSFGTDVSMARFS